MSSGKVVDGVRALQPEMRNTPVVEQVGHITHCSWGKCIAWGTGAISVRRCCGFVR